MKQRIIRFRCLSSHSTPFSCPRSRPLLERLGFREAPWWDRIEVLVVRNRTQALRIASLFPQCLVLAWTDEPYWDFSQPPHNRNLHPLNVLIANVYRGNVFTHNYHFLGSYHFRQHLDLGMPRHHLQAASYLPSKGDFAKRSLTAAVFTRHEDVATQASADSPHRLRQLRQNWALNGHAAGNCDIYGKNWGNLAIEASGYDSIGSDDWWSIKLKILQRYRYNLAFENTLWPWYVTEKIWHPLLAGCLPIYWGNGSTIYEAFEADSFIDASAFRQPADMWSYLCAVPYEDFSERFARCIRAYNRGISYWEQRQFQYFEQMMTPLHEAITLHLDNLS
jgi:alpha(1,3/1,4) fucosyltransferase